MKELSIKEKAEAYDKALEIARQYWNDRAMPIGTNFKLERMFPELKESEDERIRKKILDIIQKYYPSRKAWIAWLEKQGEQKNIEGTFINVDDVRENFVKEVYRVLANDTTNDRANDIIYYFDSLPTIYLHTNKSLPSDSDDFDMNYILKTQTWSEEDERLFQIVIDILDRQNHLGNISRTDLIACVRKLKSFRPQNTWKPSDEQMDALRYVTNFDYGGHKATLVSLYEQLKKLKG